MTQTSMLQYQRIDTTISDSPDDDAESKSIMNIAQPHHETPICTLQDTPQCRTTDVLHGSGSDSHGGKDVEHHASTGLLLNLASHRSIRDNSSPHYPPPAQPLHAPVHLLLSSAHAAAATLGVATSPVPYRHRWRKIWRKSGLRTRNAAGRRASCAWTQRRTRCSSSAGTVACAQVKPNPARRPPRPRYPSFPSFLIPIPSVESISEHF